MLRKLRVILHQRYYNRRAKRIETLVEVFGDKMITDYQEVHRDYFNEFYEMRSGRGVNAPKSFYRYVDALDLIIDRFKSVAIENRKATDFQAGSDESFFSKKTIKDKK